MKVTITIHYAEKEVEFTNLEFDDDSTWEDIFHDFASNVQVTATNEATGEELE